jgi:hypothetical protein
MRCTVRDLAQARNRIWANDGELAAPVRKLASARSKPSAPRPRLARGGSPHFYTRSQSRSRETLADSGSSPVTP